ncbi:hypothetical protein FOA52_005215 [Chlamydomonas sp. UWO 241]|nr:hypothetical protein FOA52_005215 [Chlamydomonas sp. UWO 241]
MAVLKEHTVCNECPLAEEAACKADAKRGNCVKQASPLYKAAGLIKVCSGCSCSNIAEAVRSKCYNCLSWARPGNYDGSWCTGCAAIAKFPELGGVTSVDKCMSCVINLDSFCLKKDSCAYPPRYRSDGATPFNATLAEINACWSCMSQHKFYKWGSATAGQGQCGNVASKSSTGTNPLAPVNSCNHPAHPTVFHMIQPSRDPAHN